MLLPAIAPTATGVSLTAYIWSLCELGEEHKVRVFAGNIIAKNLFSPLFPVLYLTPYPLSPSSFYPPLPPPFPLPSRAAAILSQVEQVLYLRHV
jgi:hypothetical protein